MTPLELLFASFTNKLIMTIYRLFITKHHYNVKIMEEPKIAAKGPVAVELEEGKKYFFCSCGKSVNQPFCDGAHSGSSFQPLAFTAEKTGKAFLCQCKKSANAPFCDGAHSSLS